jgi:hypothetical protein
MDIIFLHESNAPGERWSRIFFASFLLTMAASWYVMHVQPTNDLMREVIGCVGGRVPTKQVVDSCAAQVQS